MIDEELKAIVAEVAELDAESIDPSLPFADAGIDSLMAMEIAVDVERRYGLHFDDNELKQVTSLAGLVALTRRNLTMEGRESSAP